MNDVTTVTDEQRNESVAAPIIIAERGDQMQAPRRSDASTQCAHAHVDGRIAVEGAEDLRTAAMFDEHGQAQMDRETLDALSAERASYA